MDALHLHLHQGGRFADFPQRVQQNSGAKAEVQQNSGAKTAVQPHAAALVHDGRIERLGEWTPKTVANVDHVGGCSQG